MFRPNTVGQNNDVPVDDNYASESAYTDPTENSKIRAKAMYDYTAQRDDELTLVKNCIIVNIQKKDVSWWKGDYGSRKQVSKQNLQGGSFLIFFFQIGLSARKEEFFDDSRGKSLLELWMTTFLPD